MSLPETTLANPLIDAAYYQFFEVYGGLREPRRTEVDRLALELLRTTDSPSYDIISRHSPKDTPSLSTLGSSLIPVQLSTVYLEEVALLCSEQQESIQKELQLLSVSDHPPLPLLDFARISTDDRLIYQFRCALYWLNVVDQIVLSASKRVWTRWQGGWFSRRLSLVPYQGRYVLLTTDACLMFKDMMYSRFIIHLYCLLDMGRHHLRAKLDQYVQWGAEVLEALGNPGYEILKGIESLTQTALIQREETILDGSGQHKAMLDKYKEKEIKLGSNGKHVEALSRYLSSFTSSRDLAEAFGFLKLWGHPYVDPVAGCVSARDLAQAELPLLLGSCLKLEWSFCHIYCRGYLKKRGRWPPLIFLPLPSGEKTQLQDLYERGQPSLAFGFTQYSPEDWQWAQFREHQPFDMGEDILSLVVDKSLSYEREYFDATWGASLDYKPPRPPTSSRVMEELITRTSIDLPTIVERVASRDIPKSWKIVTVCPKEREMKLQPRMFSMMVLEMRLFFVLTEHNIAQGIFSSLPEQTMTMSRKELLELFLQSTKATPGSWVRAVLGIDFERWNLRWRKETVHPIGKRIDQIYGKPGVFSVVHTFFSESLCLLRQPDFPPDNLDKHNRQNPPEGRTLWYNHLGGFEGIAQKLWTTCTIALVHMALWPLGLSYRIIGQGDNQVCILDCYVPRDLSPEQSNTHVRQLVERAAASISKVSLSVGQIVKPEECIYSTCFLTYGKEMILRGAYLPTSLKYISRLFPSTTGDAPSLYEMISSISSGASGATDRNDWSYPTYFLAKCMEGITLQREMARSLFHGGKVGEEVSRLSGEARVPQGVTSRQRTLLRLALSIPSNLGGLPIATLPELMYRGHSDPLSSSLLHLCFLSHLPDVQAYKKVIWKGWLFKKTPELQGLIQDPYSLPLLSTSTPSSQVAATTAEILPTITRNVQFRELLDKATSTDKDRLIQWLSSMKPMYPKMAHDLYKSSLVGLRDAFSRRFSNTRTILSISRRAGVAIASVSLIADMSYIRQALTNFHYVWKVAEESWEFQRPDLYHVCVTLRRAWLKGDDLQGITTAHPLAVGSIRWFPHGGSDPPTPPCIVAMAFTTSSDQALYSRGPVVPYLGSSTSDKSVAKWIRPVDTSPPLKDVLKILTIRELVSTPGSTFYESLTKLAESRTKIPLELLVKFLRVKVGGILAHRYMTRDESRGSFWNSCFNWPSHITFSTNLSGELGAKDYPFDFQEAMLSLSTLLCWTFSHTRVKPNWGCCLEVDLSRMSPVGDRIVDSQPYVPSSTGSPNNYYATVMEVNVSSNAFTAAKFLRGELTLPWSRDPSSLLSATAVIFLYHFRQGNPTTTRFGHSIGLASDKRIIDLPEVGHLPTLLTLEALSLALWLKVGLSLTLACTWETRPPARLLAQMLDLESRRGIPGLSGTLREVEGGAPLFGLGIGLGRESEAGALARWMVMSVEKARKSAPQGPFFLYETGSSSVSSLLSSYLGLISSRECLSANRERFKAGKMLGRMVQRCLEAPEEQSRVRLLCAVVTAGNLGHHFRVSLVSPEETLRSLRSEICAPADHSSLPVVRRIYVPPEVTGELVGGSAQLEIPFRPLPPVVLIQSWLLRPISTPPAAERWSPLSSLYSSVQSVLLLGVGQGGISGALPLAWSVTGVELASSLQSLGHSFTTYRPPGFSSRFSLHPCSWTTTGDVYTAAVQALLLKELREGRYDLVLIDIESGSPSQRLALRRLFASTGVPSYCRVLVDQEDSVLLRQSWAAHRGARDHLWTTQSYPNREFVVGSSPSPLGVYAAVPTPEETTVRVPFPTEKDVSVRNCPLYLPTSDLLMLTGHAPTLTSDGLHPRQCRALFPFITNENLLEVAPDTWEDLGTHLLTARCPRSRIQALFRLLKANWLHIGFLSEVYKTARKIAV